jgi:hypothetical protein
MKAPIVTAVSMLLLFANIAASKRRFVPIEDAPDTELCKSTAQAMTELRKDFRGLYGKFRDPQTRVAGELQVAGLTFHASHTRTFETVDRQAVSRTYARNYYLLDIDNTPPVEMMTYSSGGHGAAGEGDTLSILEKDVSSAPLPVANEELGKVVLEITSYTTSFTGKDFDPAWFIYPFSFQSRNYLLIEGNRGRSGNDLVAEVVAGAGVVTRCYF